MEIDISYLYVTIVYAFLAFVMAVAVSTLIISKRIGMWGIFSKAGEREWKSIVPVYGQISLLKICKLKPWFVVLYLDFIIPILGYLFGRDVRAVTIIVLIGFLIYRFMIAIRLGQMYKKGDVFSFLMAFFPSILFPVIGCSKYEKYSEIVEGAKTKKK